jgi:membrane-associated phospholipid phosphatase
MTEPGLRGGVGPRGWHLPRGTWRMTPAYAAWLAVMLASAIAVAATGSNIAVFRAIQSGSHAVPAPLFEAFWQSVTYAGDGLAVFALATLLLWQRPDAAWAGMVAAIPGTVLLNVLKALIPVDRPALVLLNEGVTVLGPALHHGSFPSGHSVAAGILAGIVFLAFRHPLLRALGILAALLVALSRAAVGVHWPLDIATGLSIGWLSAWIGWQFAGDQAWPRTLRAWLVACVVLGGCAVGLLFHPMGLPAATPFRVMLAAIGVALAVAAAVHAVQLARARERVISSPADPGA